MAKRIAAMTFIFICTSIAWIILGASTSLRTDTQDVKLRGAVRQLWGSRQRQEAPRLYYQTTTERKIKTTTGAETVEETRLETTNHPVTLDASDITVGLELDHRKKGLLWYSTYRVSFSGTYRVLNSSAEKRTLYFEYRFPAENGIYDDFALAVDGETVSELPPGPTQLTKAFELAPGAAKNVRVTYKSQGMEEWWYVFGSGVSQIKDFRLTMVTDYDRVDFPETGISPTQKEESGNGWKLTWQYSNLISGVQIGTVMPQKLNPGPFVSRVSFFAPVSLFLFMFLMFIITAVRRINIHPMNYFFISAAFFSFHLLMAYLVDHVEVHTAFAVSSAVSIFLVISYMRLVAGMRFALFETGLSQFVYLVLFSYAFFLEGYTGLSITVCCIVTLFVVMQFTGRIDWGRQFTQDRKNPG